MKIRFEGCNGGGRFYFRLEIPGIGREFVDGELWDRKTATKALDLLEQVYHLKRKNIRFV